MEIYVWQLLWSHDAGCLLFLSKSKHQVSTVKMLIYTYIYTGAKSQVATERLKVCEVKSCYQAAAWSWSTSPGFWQWNRWWCQDRNISRWLTGAPPDYGRCRGHKPHLQQLFFQFIKSVRLIFVKHFFSYITQRLKIIKSKASYLVFRRRKYLWFILLLSGLV